MREVLERDVVVVEAAAAAAPTAAGATQQLEALLLQHFPLAEGERNPNELPDGVDLR